MANLYKITPENIPEDYEANNSNYLLASRAYVDACIKKLSDNINIGNAINYGESVTIDNLPINNKTAHINAEDINTDSKHRFISDAQLLIFKDKASKIELQYATKALYDRVKKLIDDAFIKLINSENAITRLKDIQTMINECEDLNSLVTLLSSKVSKEELENHESSQFHITDDDRNSLNALNNLIKAGYADWNASPEDPNYIKNKPESLPANGGNADTIDNYKSEVLLNHQAYESIIGIGNSDDRISSQVDVLLPMDNSENGNLAKLLHEMKTSRSLMFRSGKYKFDIIHLNKHSINGSPNGETIFIVKSMYIDSTTIRDIKFIDSNIHICSNVKFENVQCVNCNIYIEAAYESTIRNCDFDRCNILFNGACMYNIITNNRFKHSGNPMYYGGDNLIMNNLIY